MKILVLKGSPKRDKSDTMHITFHGHFIFCFCHAVTGFAAWMLLRREEKSER